VWVGQHLDNVMMTANSTTHYAFKHAAHTTKPVKKRMSVSYSSKKQMRAANSEKQISAGGRVKSTVWVIRAVTKHFAAFSLGVRSKIGQMLNPPIQDDSLTASGKRCLGQATRWTVLLNATFKRSLFNSNLKLPSQDGLNKSFTGCPFLTKSVAKQNPDR
jgi:hypothetical protein